MKTRSDFTVDLVDHMGSDHRVAAAARVSTGHDLKEYTSASDAGLIGYLMRNHHGTPFEHGAMTFRIEAPIFVAREFMRHRTGWSYNETSGRYRELEGVFYVPGPLRPLVQDGKPGDYRVVAAEPGVFDVLSRRMKFAYNVCWKVYRALIILGVANEVARMVLPVGVYTSFYATCNPRSLMHFLSLRNADSAMWEIREVARGMEKRFAMLYPAVWTSWEENGRVTP